MTELTMQILQDEFLKINEFKPVSFYNFEFGVHIEKFQFCKCLGCSVLRTDLKEAIKNG